MKRIKKAGTVEELIRRARKLGPDTRPRWGRLNARQMLCHVTDVARLVLGEIPTRPLFGRMSTGDWDRLLYRHTNHHFRQFGI